jgi:hypothetical protein
MPALPGPPDAPSRLRRVLGIGGVTLGVLAALGVAALFLALMGAGQAGGLAPPQSYSARTNTRPTASTTASRPRPPSRPLVAIFIRATPIEDYLDTLIDIAEAARWAVRRSAALAHARLEAPRAKRLHDGRTPEVDESRTLAEFDVGAVSSSRRPLPGYAARRSWEYPAATPTSSSKSVGWPGTPCSVSACH